VDGGRVAIPVLIAVPVAEVALVPRKRSTDVTFPVELRVRPSTTAPEAPFVTPPAVRIAYGGWKRCAAPELTTPVILFHAPASIWVPSDERATELPKLSSVALPVKVAVAADDGVVPLHPPPGSANRYAAPA
jgi:hypothetical protein